MKATTNTEYNQDGSPSSFKMERATGQKRRFAQSQCKDNKKCKASLYKWGWKETINYARNIDGIQNEWKVMIRDC